LINPKLVRCICGKQIKLDYAYREKNLDCHGEAKECTKNIISVCKFFSIDNSPAHCHQKAKACIGPTNEKIKNYVMKSPSGFGGSKSIIKAAQTLFPNKFFE
ncbi:12974_t:CDS:2, partial [Entrophospora sp. SA101]